MRFQILRADMLAVLSRVHRAITSNSIPILGNVLLHTTNDGISFHATNLDMEISATAAAEVTEPGSTTISARILYEIARRLPEGARILVETQEKTMTVRAGRSRFSLQTLPAKDFPSLVLGDMLGKFSINGADLGSLLKLASHAATDDSRTFLLGVYLHMAGGMLRAAATDGHRLVQRDVCILGLANVPGVIVPRRTATEVCFLLGEVQDKAIVAISNTAIRFIIGNVTVTSKLIDGKFPDYGRVVPLGNDKEIEVGHVALEAAVGRVACPAAENWMTVKMEVGDGMMRLSSTDRDSGSVASEELSVEYSDEPVCVGFNSRYLVETLGLLTGETVVIKLADEVTQVLLSDKDNDNTLCVLMPMRLS